MILLPANPSASAVKIFWIFLFSFALIGVGFAYCFLWTSFGFLVGSLASIVSICLAGLLFPSIATGTHRVSSACIRKVLVPAARGWISGVVYLLVLLPNRLYGRRLNRAQFLSGSNGWCMKKISILAGGTGAADFALNDTEDPAWAVLLIRWITGTRNWWMVSLIPFMLLLSLIDAEEEDRALSKDTYSLY